MRSFLRFYALAFVLGSLIGTAHAAGEPQLIIKTLKPSYARGEAPVLILEVAHDAASMTRWTVTTSAAGSIRVVSLFRQAGGRGGSRGALVSPTISPLSPNEELLRVAQRAARVLTPGSSLWIPWSVSRNPHTGGWRLLVESVPRPTKGSAAREQMLEYALGPGRYTLQVSYRPNVLPLEPTAPVSAEELLSNVVTFRME